MSSTDEKAISGLIMVPMSLKPELSVQQCDDWYNNEHVPIRMRLPYFNSGYRYRSTETDVKGPAESGLPEWLALYDILDMRELTKERYERLLGPSVQSIREHQVINKVTAWRRYYDLVSTYEAPVFASQDRDVRDGNVNQGKVESLIVVGVRLTHDTPEAEAEWDRWYEEDHLPPLRKVPGWLRTRRYRTSVIEDIPGDTTQGGSLTEYLTLNEFAPGAAIGGPEHQIAIKSESRTNIVARKWRHSYQLHYIQTPASRDLAALRQSEIEEFVSPDGMTRTLAGPWPGIDSYISTRDNRAAKYRLEGAMTKKGRSPVVVLCTWAGLSWDCWDGLVSALRQNSSLVECQILRIELSVRLQDAAEYALNTFPALDGTATDLEDCFLALRIEKASFLLIQGLGGQTTDIQSARMSKRIEKACVPESLSELCVNGVIFVSHSKGDLEEHMQSLARLATTGTGLDNFTKGVMDETQS